MKEVTAGVNTFMRPKKLRKTLSSLQAANVERVIVGDDGKEQEEKNEIYDEFEEIFERFKVIDLPFNHGLSATRNEIISEVDTDFFLMLDDDQYVHNDVLEVKSIFSHFPQLGGIGFPIIEDENEILFAHDLDLKGNCLIRHLRTQKEKLEIENLVYCMRFDLIPTAAMFRTEVFDEIVWDENYTIGAEHLDFFLQAKQTDWDFAVCVSLPVLHDPGGNPDFMSFRTGQEIEKSKAYLREKWDISAVLPVKIYYYSEKGTTLFHYLFKIFGNLLIKLPASGLKRLGPPADEIKNKIQKMTR